MAPSISVAEYYARKKIFITGATGFLGKVLVEKLLRSCPEVGTIYMLVRSKKGKNVEERLKIFLECPIFDHLKQHSPGSLTKLRFVTGDITKDGLGLSEEDRRELHSECHLLFHSAACVRFDMPLPEAVEQNLRSTKRVLELAEGMKNLEVFLHVSTSYCQTEDVVLEERLYPTPHSPEKIMDFVEWMDEDILKDIETRFIHPYGNTYGYTKALTEQLVSQYAAKFPIAIARPSIITASLKEPMPGWVDSINGPTGVVLASAKGVLRSMVCYDEAQVDGMPLDMTVNGCILHAYFTGLEKPQEVRFCNITQSGVNSKTWNSCIKLGQAQIEEYPFSKFLWVPGGTPKRSRLHHEIAAFFVHCIPAYFIDLLLFLLGKKTFMIEVYRRVKYGINVLEYYSTREWKFKNDYFLSFKHRVSKEDNETFYTNLEDLDWNSFMKNYVLGVRTYICKEDPADLPRVKRIFNIVWYIDKVLKILLYCLVLYGVYKIVTALIIISF